MVKEGGETASVRATFLLKTCLGRPPKEAEVDRVAKLYRDAREAFGQKPAKAKEFATTPLGPLPPGLDPVEAAAWTATANVVLNLDEMLLKR